MGKIISISRLFAGSMVVFAILQVIFLYKLSQNLSLLRTPLDRLLAPFSSSVHQVKVVHHYNALESSSSSSCKEAPLDPNEGFSSCLLIMDDNHYLIEWLAYHYHVLPLRRLIVATDPRSRTSPHHILERYNGLMDITVWNNETFYFPVPNERNRLRKQFPNDTVEYEKQVHYSRQRHFYSKCLDTLRHEPNRTWTLLIDSDEYLLYNANAGTTKRRIGTHRNSKSILSTLKTAAQQQPNNNNNNNNNNNECRPLQQLGASLQTNPCIMIPRLTFGTKSSTPDQVSPQEVSTNHLVLGGDGMDFTTMRWRWHAGLSNFSVNRLMKGMIDVSRLGLEFPLEPEWTVEVHYPVRQFCESQKTRTNQMSSFVVHHYMGTWEQWGYRKDVRRTKELWEQKGYDAGEDDNIRPWLEQFVDSVGDDLAKRLLEGVGQVDTID